MHLSVDKRILDPNRQLLPLRLHPRRHLLHHGIHLLPSNNRPNTRRQPPPQPHTVLQTQFRVTPRRQLRPRPQQHVTSGQRHQPQTEVRLARGLQVKAKPPTRAKGSKYPGSCALRFQGHCHDNARAKEGPSTSSVDEERVAGVQWGVWVRSKPWSSDV